MNIKSLKKYRRLKLLFFLVFYGFVNIHNHSLAEPGITDTAILIGQSCVLSGQAEDLGKNIHRGIVSALEQVNASGGIHGRRIRLIVRDDFYEPGQAIRNTQDFIFKDKVFALIGQVGTPTSRAVVPIIQKHKVPFIAPFTGDKFLRTPLKRQVVNIRAGYDEETRKIISYFVEKKQFNRIACFYQDDSYGLAGLGGVVQALKKYGLELVAAESYRRNTLAVMGGFVRIREVRPQAVILVGSYQPCAEFIKLARAKGMAQAMFATLSFTGTSSLTRALRRETENIIFSQVLPSPFERNLKIVKNYSKAMREFQPEEPLSYISFEGYIAGRFFIEVIKGVGPSLNREKFISHIEKKRVFNIDDLILTFGPDDHQGLDNTYLTRVWDGTIIQMTDKPEPKR